MKTNEMKNLEINKTEIPTLDAQFLEDFKKSTEILKSILEKEQTKQKPTLNKLMKLKRDIAKTVVTKYFKSQGLLVKPATSKNSDLFVHKENGNGFHVLVRTKPRMLLHNATGFETNVKNKLDILSEDSKVMVIFVDDVVGGIYGNWYHKILQSFTDGTDRWKHFPHYQTFSGNAEGVFFNLQQFTFMRKLTETELFFLVNASNPEVREYPKAIFNEHKANIRDDVSPVKLEAIERSQNLF
jgi:hypothetical protein